MSSQAVNDKEGEVQSRYGYLLKPIRDLFKNWEIDIAAELEEYLHEMEQIKISFDGGQTVMNFAEAALLIQGSACIYSKKVEYLYTLVYQTLDLIASKRKLQQASSVDEQGKDKDVSCHDQQQEDEFLLLDDIKEAKNIVLKENLNQFEGSGLVPRTPVTLITFDDSKKGSALLSYTGEVLGNRNDFKMNSCTVHLGSGALLLDLSHLHLVQSKAFQRTPPTPHTERILETQNIQQDGRDGNNTPSNGLDGGESNHFVEISAGQEGFNSVGDMDCDDVILPPLTPSNSNVEGDVVSVGMKLRERNARRASESAAEQKLKDPWETLDPHDPNGGIEKPCRKGRPFTIPDSIRDVKLSTRKRKRKSAELKNEKLIPIAEFCRQAYHSQAKKLPKNPLKTLTYHEFEYIYWEEFRRRQLLERKTRKILSRMLSGEEYEKLQHIASDLDKNNNDEAPQDGLDYDNDDEGLDYNDNDNDGEADFGNHCKVVPAGETVEPMALEQSDDLVVSSYEELVRKYVQGFLIQAQQYVQETELSKRVKDWESKVVPKLEDEDSHQPYDIHKYGENVLSMFSDTKVKSFQEVVVSKEPWEICRYFLASLQLANNYNVEIRSNGDDIEMDFMQLRLLHRTPVYQAISKYRAPSVLT